jgi:DNA-binding MarR family transcriptional regulator
VPERPHLHLDDYLPYLINRVGSALVLRFTAETLASHRLSIGMWRVLAVLSNNGAQRQVDLADMTSIESSTLSRLVTRIVRLGLVRRGRSRNNSREVLVQLTPKGRALVDRLIPVARELEHVAVAGIPEQELAVVRRVLRQMYANLEGPARDSLRGLVGAKAAVRSRSRRIASVSAP